MGTEIYLKQGDELKVIYGDKDLSKRLALEFDLESFTRLVNRENWIGAGGNFGEEHGTFLSNFSDEMFKIKENFVVDNLADFSKPLPEEISSTDFDIYELNHNDVGNYAHISVLYKLVLKLYVDSVSLVANLDKKNIVPFLREYLHNNILRVVSESKDGVFVVDPPKGDSESFSLNDSQLTEEGKLVKINGEICIVKNIMEEDPTRKKLLVPVRFIERYGEKGKSGDNEAIKKVCDLVCKSDKAKKVLRLDLTRDLGKLSHLKHRIPEYDPTFLLNRPEYMDFITLFTSQGFSKILLSGDAGVGKSELVQQVCSRMNLPLIRIDFSGEILSEQILWTQNYDPVQKKMVVVEGLIPYAVRNGIKLCLEEFSSIPPSVAFELHRLMEKGEIYIKDNDTLIKPHPNFSIVATDNRIGNPNFQKYFGTQQQNSALISRINNCIWIPYPNKKLEMDYLKLKFHKSEDLVVLGRDFDITSNLLESIVDFANDVRPKYQQGELGFTISPRDVVSFLDSVYKLEDVNKAFEYSILNFHKGFQSDELAIKNLFNKYFGGNSKIDFSTNVGSGETISDGEFFNRFRKTDYYSQ